MLGRFAASEITSSLTARQVPGRLRTITSSGRTSIRTPADLGQQRLRPSAATEGAIVTSLLRVVQVTEMVIHPDLQHYLQHRLLRSVDSLPAGQPHPPYGAARPAPASNARCSALPSERVVRARSTWLPAFVSGVRCAAPSSQTETPSRWSSGQTRTRAATPSSQSRARPAARADDDRHQLRATMCSCSHWRPSTAQSDCGRWMTFGTDPRNEPATQRPTAPHP